MRFVAILGAGASAAEAASHRPQQTREHPPLDTNFFSKVAQLDPPLRSSLILQCRSMGIPNPFQGPEPRMEQVFGDIYFEVVEGRGKAQEVALDGYRTLLRVYGRVLAQTTNWMWDRPLGAIGRFLRSAIQTPDLTHLSLVTFNHDLLIENALTQLPYRQRWCVDQGYGPISLRPTGTTRNFPRLNRHSPDCDHSIQIEVLKLHGSLNWQVETRSHDPSYRDLFPSPQSVPTIECITDRVVSVTLSRRRGKRRWRLWPQIVPPIYQKLDIVSARFSPLWRHAAEAVERADRVAMIGYSMPATDAHATNLIRRGIRRNRTLRRVDVINHDPAIAARVGELGHTDCVRWFREFSAYVELETA